MYFEALYSESASTEFDLRCASSLREIPAETSGAVIHANWLWNIAVPSSAAAQAWATEMIDHLDRLLAQDCRLVWSIHEPHNHEFFHRDEEIEFSQALVARATKLHALAPDTVQRCAPFFDIAHAQFFSDPHPAPLPATARSNRSDARDLLERIGVPDDVDVVVSLGMRRRYKNVEAIARSVHRRNQHRENRRCLMVSAGQSLPFPKDTAAPRLRRHGAVSVDAFVPTSVYTSLLLEASATGLAYASGVNSGVLADALTAGTPAFCSNQVAVDSYDSLELDTVYDVDGGHKAIDGALDRSLAPEARDRWRAAGERFGVEYACAPASERFLTMAATLHDHRPPVGLPAISARTVRPFADQLVRTRYFAHPRAEALALRKIAEASQQSGDPLIEFDALEAWFECPGYVPESEASVERFLELGVDLGRVRASITSLHRAIDSSPAVARFVAKARVPAPGGRVGEILDIGVADLASRVDEVHSPDPLTISVQQRLAQLIDTEHAERR